MIASVYAAAFLDHFQHPRGQGSLPEATHTARREDPACGDVLELDLQIAERRVVAARFRVSGCAGAIAAGSALVTLLPGRAARADAVTREELVAELGEVPDAKRHALRLAVGSFRDALASPVG